MQIGSDYAKLVKKAQLGDEKSLGLLSEWAGERLRVYVYRLTLDAELTQDIVQEAMLEMIKFLDRLENTERFWPWLRTIATNKVHHHYRQKQERRGKIMSVYREKYEGTYKDKQDGFANLVSEELKQIVTTTMQDLKARHRQVLVLRCYEQLGYSEIADEMDCSEFGARMLFLRAKKSLAKKLSRQGLGRGSLVTALVFFGKMTAPSKAAAAEVSVTAATLKVGAAAGVAGAVASKTAIVSMTAAGMLAVGTMMVTPEPERAPILDGEIPTINLPATTHVVQTKQINEECWYYYPEGRGRSVMMRLEQRGERGRQSFCQWVQDEQSNYYFDSSDNTIYINNYRMWNSDLSVRRLPTDSSIMRESLSKVEGDRKDMAYVPYGGSGLLVIVKNDGEGGIDSQVVRHHKLLDEEYFRYDWPSSARIVDNRDEMHRRGWTYFRISGDIDGQTVIGTGQIPFVHSAIEEHPAWLRMQIGSSFRILDNGSESHLYGSTGKLLGRYKGGSFLKGLGRPWMGLHTIDTVRRDAAEKQMSYEAQYGPQSGKAEVTVSYDYGNLVYTIDLERDVIEKITISTNDGRSGELQFSYMEEIVHIGGEFAEPSRHRRRRTLRQVPGTLWLAQIMEGTLGE